MVTFSNYNLISFQGFPLLSSFFSFLNAVPLFRAAFLLHPFEELFFKKYLLCVCVVDHKYRTCASLLGTVPRHLVHQ